MFQGCIDDFDCANQGQSSLISGVDEIKELCKTRRALSRLGERASVRGFPISESDHGYSCWL